MQWVIGLLVSAVALGLAFVGVNLGDVLRALATADYAVAPWVVALVFVGQLCRAKSWQTILGYRLPLAAVFSALNAGYLLNNVLPLRLGEVGRAYLISRSQNLSTAHALSSVLVERVIDLCMLVGMLVAFAPLAIGLTGAPVAVVVAFVLPVIALSTLSVIARRPLWIQTLWRRVIAGLGRWWPNAGRLEVLFDSLVEGMSALKESRRFWVAVGWSGATWLTAGLIAWLVLRAFVPTATLEMAYFVLVVVGLGIAVPSTPGAIGVWQAAAVAALSVFQVEKTIALSFGLMHHFVIFALLSMLGAFALAREGESLAHLAASARLLLARTPSDVR